MNCQGNLENADGEGGWGGGEVGVTCYGLVSNPGGVAIFQYSLHTTETRINSDCCKSLGLYELNV